MRGKASTYDLEVGVKVDMEDMIHQISPHETPLIGMYGADGRSAIAQGPATQKKVEWLEDTLYVPRDTLAASVASGGASITVGNGLKWSVGDIIRIGAEVVEVGAVSSNTLAVTRGYGDTSGASAASGADIVGIGRVLPEGSDPNEARAGDRTPGYNWTEIFGPEKIDVTGTELVIAKYGLRGINEFDYQLGQRIKEMAIAIEQAVLYGERFDDSATKKRSMGGLDFFITTNNNTTVGSLTETALLDSLQDAWDAGGYPDRVLVPAAQKRTISAFGQTNIRYGRQDNGRGQVVDFYDSDFGRVSILLHRWVRSTDMFVFSRDNVELETLRGLRYEALAKTGDSKQGMIVCEKTLKVRREKHAAKFSALT